LVLISVPAYRLRKSHNPPKKYVKQGLERFGRNDIVGAIAEYDRDQRRSSMRKLISIAAKPDAAAILTGDRRL
jgi:hypothetical protein